VDDHLSGGIVATSKEVTKRLEKVIEIYSDSQAVLKAHCSAKMGNILIQNCWDALNKVAEQKHVNLVWIPAHMWWPGSGYL